MHTLKIYDEDKELIFEIEDEYIGPIVEEISDLVCCTNEKINLNIEINKCQI